MPTYALLGATGSTGSAILRNLLSQPPANLTLNIFVRSPPKLHTAFPNLQTTTAPKINIIEGTPSNNEAMQKCLKDVDVVLACIGTNESKPGMSISQDTAAGIVSALEAHRQIQGPAYTAPTVIQLRTASLNPVYKAALPWLARTVVGFCLYHVYDDLDRACKHYESVSSSSADSSKLLDYIYIDPPGLMDAEGTTPTGYRLVLDGKLDSALSYSDLGVAFCEVAERRGEFVGKAVGVTATGEVKQTPGALVGYLAAGAKGRILG